MSKYADAVERFAAGGDRLRNAIKGLTREEALARPGPGTWSIQELVIHLADSDAIVIDRMKRILTEDNPALLCADETAYVERLHSDAQSLEDAVDLFDLGRRQIARVLRQLNDSQFDRVGTHSQTGIVSLAKLVRGYADHLDHHLEFLVAKRRNMAQRE
jgi:uncharacterized damage-inducible protein DinB